MPELDDAKMETFCQKVAAGKTQKDAYLESDFGGHPATASNFIKKGDVRGRILEINPEWSPRKRRHRAGKGKCGSLYALTNPSHPGVFKIGHTTREFRVRLGEINNAGVLVHWEEYRVLSVPNSSAAEGGVHSRLEQYRIHAGKEFFRVDKSVVDQVFHDASCGIFHDFEKDIIQFTEGLPQTFWRMDAYRDDKNKVVNLVLGNNPATGADHRVCVSYNSPAIMNKVLNKHVSAYQAMCQHTLYSA